MKSIKILEHIDKKVISNLENNYDMYKIIDHLDFLVTSFKKRDSYKEIDEIKILENWNNIPIRTRYTTYYVISCLKRLNGINWILSKNIQMDDIKKYKLVILKSKIENEY
jgi:hypothetical protein